jgi:hypothetical protein
MYSLATAAAACGVSKSVILRAMIAGKISGSKERLLSHLKVLFTEMRLSVHVP